MYDISINEEGYKPRSMTEIATGLKIGSLVMLAVAIIMSLLVMSGCESNINRESEIRKMTKYINKRYEDDKFIFHKRSNSNVGGVGRGTPGALFYSEKYPNAEILVRYRQKEASFFDNYLYFMWAC
jgi:hypothetical protein